MIQLGYELKLKASLGSMFLLKVLLHSVHEIGLVPTRGTAMSSQELFQHRHCKLSPGRISR